MKILAFIALSCLSGFDQMIQSAATPPPAVAPLQSSSLGFSYSLPSDWAIEDTAPLLPTAQLQAGKAADSEVGKKAISCLQIPLKATHGTPAATVVVIALPYDCQGATLTDADLASFGGGVAKSLKKTWEIASPAYGAYSLGSHSVWIEKGTGTSISHPEVTRSIEVVCSILKKSAVCWMAVTPTEADLKAFEQGEVSLDGESPTALVPPFAFTKIKMQ